MAKKARIGDVCEIKTPAGLAYVQYTHPHPSMGQLVRVLPGLFARRPDVGELTKKKELYFIFYTLNYALRDGQTEIISNETIPEWARPYPLMRHERDFTNPPSWLIADASKQLTVDEIPRMLRVTQLSAEQKKISISMLCPHGPLVKMLAEGWTPERDEEINLQAQASKLVETGRREKEGDERSIDHYLYFPSKAKAEEAGKRLGDKGWKIEVKLGADHKSWLVLAKQPAPIDDIGAIRDELERFADDLGGDYDGWGAGVWSFP